MKRVIMIVLLLFSVYVFVGDMRLYCQVFSMKARSLNPINAFSFFFPGASHLLVGGMFPCHVINNVLNPHSPCWFSLHG